MAATRCHSRRVERSIPTKPEIQRQVARDLPVVLSPQPGFLRDHVHVEVAQSDAGAASGEIAARFHVSALNASGKSAGSGSAPAIREGQAESARLAAVTVPMHCRQFAWI